MKIAKMPPENNGFSLAQFMVSGLFFSYQCPAGTGHLKWEISMYIISLGVSLEHNN